MKNVKSSFFMKLFNKHHAILPDVLSRAVQLLVQLRVYVADSIRRFSLTKIYSGHFRILWTRILFFFTEMDQHEMNINRRVRTMEYTLKHSNNSEAVQDPNFSFRTHVVTTRFFCSCRDCEKYGCYGKPIKCIDPYILDMRYTNWIYYDLVAATTTASARVDRNIGSEPRETPRETTRETPREKPKEKRKKR